MKLRTFFICVWRHSDRTTLYSHYWTLFILKITVLWHVKGTVKFGISALISMTVAIFYLNVGNSSSDYKASFLRRPYSQALGSYDRAAWAKYEARKPTRCNNYMFIINFCLNMFRASLCPSSGEKRPCYCIWCVVLVLLDVVGSGCGALSCRTWSLVLLKMGLMMPEICWDRS